jgi:hypothetical protein
VRSYLAASSASAYSAVSMLHHFGPMMPKGSSFLSLSYLASEMVCAESRVLALPEVIWSPRNEEAGHLCRARRAGLARLGFRFQNCPGLALPGLLKRRRSDTYAALYA